MGELLLKIGISIIGVYLILTVISHIVISKKERDFSKEFVIFYRKILYCLFVLFAIVMMWLDYQFLINSVGLIGAGVLLVILFLSDMFIIQGATLKKFGIKEVEFGQQELQELKEVIEVSNELIQENDQTMNAIRLYINEQSQHQLSIVNVKSFLKNFNRYKFQVNIHEFEVLDNIMELATAISEKTDLNLDTISYLLDGEVYYNEDEMKAYAIVIMNSSSNLIELESNSEKLNENDMNSILMLFHIYYFMDSQREGTQ